MMQTEIIGLGLVATLGSVAVLSIYARALRPIPVTEGKKAACKSDRQMEFAGATSAKQGNALLRNQ